jgi:hypothetical protein
MVAANATPLATTIAVASTANKTIAFFIPILHTSWGKEITTTPTPLT